MAIKEVKKDSLLEDDQEALEEPVDALFEGLASDDENLWFLTSSEVIFYFFL